MLRSQLHGAQQELGLLHQQLLQVQWQNTPPPPEPPSEPVPVVTGISMNSVVKGSGGPAVRVGNTTYGDPNGEKFVKPEDVKGYAGGKPGFKAAKASTLSKEATPSCKQPPYPKELADQNIEGVTGLLLEVDAAGTLITHKVTDPQPPTRDFF